MLCYSPLVGGQNGTPVLGLCHFISEKNVVQAPRVFMVNSYIELSRFYNNKYGWDAIIIRTLSGAINCELSMALLDRRKLSPVGSQGVLF